MTVVSDNTRITTLSDDEDGSTKFTAEEIELVERALGRLGRGHRDSDAGQSLLVKLIAMRNPTHPEINAIEPYKTDPGD